jgi:hypothetical protein
MSEGSEIEQRKWGACKIRKKLIGTCDMSLWGRIEGGEVAFLSEKGQRWRKPEKISGFWYRAVTEKLSSFIT